MYGNRRLGVKGKHKSFVRRLVPGPLKRAPPLRGVAEWHVRCFEMEQD